jgi:hypothetical protein
MSTPNSQFEEFEPDLAGIRANIAIILEDADASAFVRDLLSRVQSESNPLVEGGDLLKIFDLLIGPGQGGVRRAPIGGGRMNGSIKEGTATILLSGIGTGSVGGDNSPELRKAFQLFLDSDKIIHELCHASGSFSYSDEQLARAVSQMDNAPPLPEIKLPANPTVQEATTFVHTMGTYWNRVLKQHCKSTPQNLPGNIHIGTSEDHA